jgi:hypothetical protein
VPPRVNQSSSSAVDERQRCLTGTHKEQDRAGQVEEAAERVDEPETDEQVARLIGRQVSTWSVTSDESGVTALSPCTFVAKALPMRPATAAARPKSCMCSR